MKTVIYDINTKIIKGFGEAQIDPVETKKIVDPLLKNTDEMKVIKQRKQNIKSKNLICNQAKFDLENVFYLCAKRLKMTDREMKFLMRNKPAEAKEKLNAKEIATCDKLGGDLVARINEIAGLSKDVADNFKLLESKKKEFILSKAVYFGCRAGEKIVNEVAYQKYVDAISKLGEGEKLTIDFVVVAPVVEESEVIEEN